MAIYYKNTKLEIENIKNYFSKKFGENNKIESFTTLRNVTFIIGSSYSFTVWASFIQCRIEEDFFQSIEKRLHNVFYDKKYLPEGDYELLLGDNFDSDGIRLYELRMIQNH